MARRQQDITDRHVWSVAILSSLIWTLIFLGLLGGAPERIWWMAAFLALGLTAVAHIVESRRAPASWFRRRYVWGLIATAICVFMMTVPLGFILVLFEHGDIRYASKIYGGFTLVGVAVSFAFMAGAMGVLEARQRWVAAALLAPLMLIALCILLGSFSAVSVVVVNGLGLGEQHAVRAVVSGKTCRQVNLALGQVVCREGLDDEPSVICPAVLRSRIGSQVLLEFAAMGVEANGGRASLEWQSLQPEPDKPTRFQRVVLDKAQLLTWSDVATYVASATAASAPSTPVLASWLRPTDAATGIATQPEPLRTVLGQVCELVPRAADVPASAASSPNAASAVRPGK